MEVSIRLQKQGKSAKKHYNYRIVAITKRSARDARHIDHLGYYDAAKDPAVFKIDEAKLEKWLACGAKMSDTVKSLVKKQKKQAK